jgi:hypothetical protein
MVTGELEAMTKNTSKGNQPIDAEIIMHCTFHYISEGSVHAFMFVLGCQLHHFTDVSCIILQMC